MKTVIQRSICASLLLICLGFSAFATDGEMGTGSKKPCGSNCRAANTTTNANIDDAKSPVETESDFLGWIAAIFADVLG